MLRPQTISSPAAAQGHQSGADRAHAGGHDLRRFAVFHALQGAGEIFVGWIEVSRVEEAAFDLVLEQLLHSLRAQEGIGRGVGDRRIDVAEFPEDEVVLDARCGIEGHVDTLLMVMGKANVARQAWMEKCRRPSLRPLVEMQPSRQKHLTASAFCPSMIADVQSLGTLSAACWHGPLRRPPGRCAF
jgi:hypothetical protein